MEFTFKTYLIFTFYNKNILKIFNFHNFYLIITN